MATAAGNVEGNKEKAAGGSLLAVIIAVLGLSVVAAAGGGFLGYKIYTQIEKSVQLKLEAAQAKKQAEKTTVPETARVRALVPIITNLASPQNAWVRLEASIVFDGEPGPEADLLTAKVSEDIVAFLRTVSIGQIEGANGFQNLREDLSERVKVRGAGRIRELVIHTFVVE